MKFTKAKERDIVKVLLINPPHFQLYVPIAIRYFQLPLAYLAAAIRKTGDDVSIFDSLAYDEDTHVVEPVNDEQKSMLEHHEYYNKMIHWGASWNRIMENIRVWSPDIIGITCHQASVFLEVSILAKLIKEYDKKIKIIVGGAFPTVRAREVLQNSYIDYIIKGEGEQTIVELIAAIKGRKKIDSVRGIGYKINDEIKITGNREYLDVNQIPFPALDLLPLERYFRKQKFRYTFLLTSRGCVNNCSYCGVSAIMGCNHRKRSPEHVLKEIRWAYNEFNIDNFYIRDDNFTLDMDRVDKILDLIIEDPELKNCKFYAVNGIDANYLTQDLVKKMKRANFEHITLAVETINTRIQGEIEKKVDNQHIEELINSGHQNGINDIGIFLMGGIPGEKIQGVMDTIIYVLQNGARPRMNLYYPIPNTKLYEQLKSTGMIKKEYYHQYRSDLPYIQNDNADVLVTISMITIALKTVWSLIKENIFTPQISLLTLLEFLKEHGYKILEYNSEFTIINVSGDTNLFQGQQDSSIMNFNGKLLGAIFSIFSGEYYQSEITKMTEKGIIEKLVIKKKNENSDIGNFYKRIYTTLSTESALIPEKIKCDTDILKKSIT